MSDLITADLVLLDENLGDTRFDVIAKLAEAVVKAGRAADFEQLYAAAEARESKTDTGIPGGIAIPHCRSAAVTEPTLAMARPNPAVSFGAKDGPADLIFFIAAPDGADQAHLKLLSALARSLMKKSFTASLREASSAEEVVELVNGALGVGEKKAEAMPAEAVATPATAEQEAPKASEGAPAMKKLVAVTACPTGIAHTYMAADALKYAAEELGYDLKVETQGSSGNETLSQADIDAADAVIFAVSVNVRDRNRFAGKPFVESPVKRGIDEPKEMIAEALGTLKLPRWLGSMMPVVVTPLVTSLVTGLVMYLLLGAPLAWVMTTLQDWLTSMSGGSALVLGLILGAMMASDLGGPINKAAYLFATAGLSSGATVNQEIMAAVIISGMVPPLAMALATTLRPKLFNENERENGKAAWLLGASFISEGAIPFASADPARVIPSTIVGGALAGAISMSAHVASPAPHGGIWIIGLAQNPLMFFVAVLAGTVVSALVYVVLKSVGARSKASA